MFGLTGRELRFAVIISVAHLTQHFLMRLLPPLIPVLSVALEYPLWQLGLLISTYSLGGGLAQAPIGVLSDRYDRRFIMPTGITVAGLAYVLFAAAPMVAGGHPGLTLAGYRFEGPFLVMVAAMVIVGVGAAVTHPTGYPMISVNVRPGHTGKVFGAFGGSSKLGDALSPTIIGVLILALAWPQIIALLGLAGAAVGVLLFVALRSDAYDTRPTEPPDETPNPDADAADADDNRTYLYPLTVIYVFFVTKMFASNGINAFLPAFVVAVYAYSADVAGVALGAESVANFYFAVLLFAAAVSQFLLGSLVDRFDARAVILGCMAVSTVAIVTLAVVDLSPILLVVIMLVLGGGLWGPHPARDSLISDITPSDREGRTFGYIWTAVQLTGAVIPVLVGYVIEVMGMRSGFLLLAIGVVLAGASVLLLYHDRIYVPRNAPEGRTTPPS